MESLRRLCVVLIWLGVAFACYMVNLVKADWEYYLMWIGVGYFAHKLLNWIFQHEDDGDW